MIGFRLAALGFGLVLLGIVACAPAKENADSTSVLTIDTVKPATSAMQDPVGATTATDSTPSQPAKTKATPTKKTASTKQSGTKELGRDSIIRRDPRDPRYQLPAVDTTKKP